MHCNTNCPHVGGARNRPEGVRRKLEFSDPETSQETPTGPQKYDNFKKVSESHSSTVMEPPMYTSMGTVPESFLAAFGGKQDVALNTGSQRRAAPPPREASPEAEMPGSFLEFCQARIAARPTPAKTPPRTPVPEGSYYVQGPSPYNTSYYGYEDPAAQHGIIFNPKATSTPYSPKKVSPKTPHPGYYYPPPFHYYPKAAPSYETESSYPSPRAGAVGIGKYAYPASSSPPTPPTPASVCEGACAKSGMGESTVSSGDFLGSSSRRRTSGKRSSKEASSSVSPCSPPAQSAAAGYGMASYRYPTPPPGAVGIGKYAYPASHSSATPPTPPSACGGPCSRSSTFDESAIGAPLAQSTPNDPQFRYEISSRRETSVSSIPSGRRKSETACTDDLLDSGKSGQRCPTLGVTPVHSAASVSSSAGNLATGNRQKISKSIETELLAREIQERNQLENDLTRWQEARRRLVMNTANMGS